jgi:hypothetical protein
LEAIEAAAVRLAKTSNTTHELIQERAAVADIYLNLWDRIQSKEWNSGTAENAVAQCRNGAKKACGALRSFTRVFPIGRPMTWLRLGQYRHLAGHTGKARDAWARGILSAREIKMPYLEALIEFEIGRSLMPDDAGHREHLQRACDLFRAVGAEYDLAQAESALRQS